MRPRLTDGDCCRDKIIINMRDVVTLRYVNVLLWLKKTKKK